MRDRRRRDMNEIKVKDVMTTFDHSGQGRPVAAGSLRDIVGFIVLRTVPAQ